MNRSRSHVAVRRLFVLSLLAGLTLVVSPLAAHADGWRTATAFASGPTPDSASANAQGAARDSLTLQGIRAGETCTNVTSSAQFDRLAPDGTSRIYLGTATGFCAVTPPYTVSRNSVRSFSSSNPNVARDTANTLARNDILAAGVSCGVWSVGGQFTTAVPSSFTYRADISALCTN